LMERTWVQFFMKLVKGEEMMNQIIIMLLVFWSVQLWKI
jgi:hypothetical protein